MKSMCKSVLLYATYLLIALLAMIAYFHIQCQKEKQEGAPQEKFKEFNPEETDVKDYNLGFCKIGETLNTDIGIEYILVQSAPCAVMRMLEFFSIIRNLQKSSAENHTVTFNDARKNNPGSFHETGFTLIELEEEPITTDWRSPSAMYEDADVVNFQKQMEPHILKLYPHTKRMTWTYNVVRGGDRLLDQPKAVDGPHLDYHQNDSARLEFHERFPLGMTWQNKYSEPRILMGLENGADDKLGVLLGVWKPIRPNVTVCDNPLAIMDARTFDNEHLSFMELHIDFGPLGTFHNLNGAIAFDPRQRWYYYPFQTTREVLIFHQYSTGKFFANPHTSFNNANCPADTESRISVEMRLALFF